MKILHVLQNYEPSKGGTQLLFKSVSEKLKKQYGDEITVATTNSMYDPGSRIFKALNSYSYIEGIHVFRFRFNRIKRKFFLLLKDVLGKLHFDIPESLHVALRVPQSKALKLFINNFKADIVCASSSNYVYMDYARYRMHLHKPKPFVFMGAVHFDDDKSPYLSKWNLDNIKASDLYIANTIFEKNVLTRLGVDANTIRVIGCGVELDDYSKSDKTLSKKALALPDDSIVLGYIGRFAPSKDILLLIEAFSELNLTKTYLLLAGASNSYLREIRRRIEKLPQNISNKIVFKIDFNENEKSLIFNSLDVFVSPSFSESFGIVFLEAWASHIPVIGSNIGAIASVIAHNKDGLLFNARDKDSLKDSLMVYLNDLHLRKNHAEEGFKKVKENYTWDIIAMKYRAVYNEAIEIFNKKCVDLQA